MNKKVKAIIFDLDDTLINYGGVTKQAWYLTCDELKKNFNFHARGLNPPALDGISF